MATFKAANVKSSLVQNRFDVTGQLSPAVANVANVAYTAGLGVSCDFSGRIQTNKAPDWVLGKSANVAGVSAYSYAFHAGADAKSSNVRMQIFTAGSEITGNVPSAVGTDVIHFNALFPRK